MSTVKQTAKTTMTLIVLFIGLYVLTLWCKTFPNELLYNIQRSLQSKHMLGSFNAIILSVAFWALLIASAECAIIRDLSALKICKAFGIPITISAIASIGTVIPGIDFYWFWTCYFVLMIFGVRSSFTKLSMLNTSSSGKILPFIKEIGKEREITGSRIDFYIEYGSKLFLLFLLAVLIVTLIVFCIQNSNSLF